MGIVVPETCWASNKICNKNLCCIQLAFYFYILTKMHGQNHIKFVNDNICSKSHKLSLKRNLVISVLTLAIIQKLRNLTDDIIVIISWIYLTLYYHYITFVRVTRWCSSLRSCATSRKVTGSISDEVIGILHWLNPSCCITDLRSTQSLTEFRTRVISWRVKAAGA